MQTVVVLEFGTTVPSLPPNPKSALRELGHWQEIRLQQGDLKTSAPVRGFTTAFHGLYLCSQNFLQITLEQGGMGWRIQHTFLRSTVATRLVAASNSAAIISSSASLATTSWSGESSD